MALEIWMETFIHFLFYYPWQHIYLTLAFLWQSQFQVCPHAWLSDSSSGITLYLSETEEYWVKADDNSYPDICHLFPWSSSKSPSVSRSTYTQSAFSKEEPPLSARGYDVLPITVWYATLCFFSEEPNFRFILCLLN